MLFIGYLIKVLTNFDLISSVIVIVMFVLFEKKWHSQAVSKQFHNDLSDVLTAQLNLQQLADDTQQINIDQLIDQQQEVLKSYVKLFAVTDGNNLRNKMDLKIFKSCIEGFDAWNNLHTEENDTDIQNALNDYREKNKQVTSNIQELIKRNKDSKKHFFR